MRLMGRNCYEKLRLMGSEPGNFILREPEFPYDLQTMPPFRDIVNSTKGPSFGYLLCGLSYPTNVGYSKYLSY